MMYTTSRLYGYARVAIWTTVVLGALQLNAAEVSSSCTPVKDPDKSDAAPSADQLSPKSECNIDTSGKYAVDRIGRRSIGKGANLYSLEEERSLGEAMAAAVDRQTKLVTNPKVKDYISNLGQKIVRNSDSQVPFVIKVMDSKNPTTFSLPGGFLYVDVGLILDVDDEAQLAGLMAHEIAHVTARHATRLATRKESLDVLSFSAAKFIGPAALPARQIGLLPLDRKFSREFEFEADLLGIEYQYAAGYDPQAYIDALEKLDGEDIQKRTQALKTQPKPDWVDRLYMHIGQAYSAYPLTELRILRLQTEISKLLPCRNDYVLDTGEFQEVKAQLGAARLILRRPRPGDSTSGPILQRHPSPDEE